MPLDRRLLQRTEGRRTILGPFGIQILLLTTVGAKSGQRRTSPLLYVRDGNSLIVVGSNYGGDHHPAWSANLLKTPQARVTMVGTTIPVTAELLRGEESDAAYQLMTDVTRTYAEYRSRTDRAIRVFRLTATTAAGQP